MIINNKNNEIKLSNPKKYHFFNNQMNYIIKRINIMSLSGYEFWRIYPLILKLRRYFFSRNIYSSDLSKKKYCNLKRKKEIFTEKEDGTYDMHSHKKVSFNKGYQVSFETNYDNYSDSEYDEIAYKMSLISDNHIYLGVYNSTPEMSFYFNDYELANAISILFNQTSIWDWSKMDEIKNEYYREKGNKLL